jgi:hypothetical protein
MSVTRLYLDDENHGLQPLSLSLSPSFKEWAIKPVDHIASKCMFKSNGQRKWKLASSKHVKATVFGKLLSSSDGGRFEVAILSKKER